jgi:hypothetical protein
MVETRNVSWSVVLHAVLLIIAVVGLPALLPKKPDPVPLVMSVELLPISDTSNVKPSDQPIQKAQFKPEPTPPKLVPAPPAPKAPPAPTPPAPTPPPPKTFDPDEGAEKKDKIKPVEKPPEPPKPTIDQKTTEDFNKILADMKLKAEKEQAAAVPTPKDAKDKANVAENKTKSDAPYNDALPLSISEKDAIRGQFIPCWTMPAGAKDAHSLAVRVKVQLQADGTVLDAQVAPDQLARYNSDTFFRAAADSAVRAVHKCSPLKNLPADKYGTWKDTEINFDPQDM